MEQLELDLSRITKIAKQKEDENFDFRIFLKGLDFDKVDEIVHGLDVEIREKIDCRLCGNCCKILQPGVSDAEIDTLSHIDKLSKDEFISRFVEKDEFDGENFLKDTPCKYLDDKICTIYPNRPENCRSYPYTHKDEFISRTLGVIDNYAICPIVFNLFEQLKSALNYHY